jgi:4-oxalocrotonate tautomerase
MPVVTVQMFRGRTLEQKRALVRAITDAMVEHAAAKPDALIVVIQETEPENWAMAGRLVADRDSAGGQPGSGQRVG